MTKSLPLIHLTNTRTGKTEPLHTHQPGKLSMYSCGPTVYDFAHVGNFRTFLVNDLLVRTFGYAGYDVTRVSNITDVGHLTEDDLADADGEDKILKKARVENKDPLEIARAFERFFIEDEQKLRIMPPDHRPRATEWIPQQIEMTEQLLEKGYAYEVNGSVYFRVHAFDGYGDLSGNKLDDLQAGARIEVNSEKESPLDFALWKHADPTHLMQWESPWGRGFPGWHIECSVMSTAILGPQFDLHTGGEDLIFPHHECEIAQNECSCGKSPSVTCWVHVKHLLVEGKKMSKSKGNFFTIRDLFEKGYTGLEIRLALMKGHYRTAMNFTFASLDEARTNIKRINQAWNDVKNTPPDPVPEDIITDYQTALFQNLNVADALAVAFGAMDQFRQGMLKPGQLHAFFQDHFDPIFDLFVTDAAFSSEEKKEIEQLIEKRKQAKGSRDFTTADGIRDQLLARGIELKDTAKGTTFHRI